MPIGDSYTDDRYSIVHTHHFPTAIGVDTATGVEGVGSRTNLFRLPYRAKIVKFGIIPVVTGATFIIGTDQPVFALKLESAFGVVATELATFHPAGSDSATLTQWEATGAAPEAATCCPANRVVMPCVITPSASGTCMFFFDYQEQFDSS